MDKVDLFLVRFLAIYIAFLILLGGLESLGYIDLFGV